MALSARLAVGDLLLAIAWVAMVPVSIMTGWI
jgi:hypothetical protein